MNVEGDLLFGAVVLLVLAIGAAARCAGARDYGPMRDLADPLMVNRPTPDPSRDPSAGSALEAEIEVVIEVYRLDRYQPPVARDLRRIAREFGSRRTPRGPDPRPRGEPNGRP